jgi:hypothetical protein
MSCKVRSQALVAVYRLICFAPLCSNLCFWRDPGKILAFCFVLFFFWLLEQVRRFALFYVSTCFQGCFTMVFWHQLCFLVCLFGGCLLGLVSLSS